MRTFRMRDDLKLLTATAVTAAVIEVAIGMTQMVEVTERSSLEAVEFGWPTPWLIQEWSL